MVAEASAAEPAAVPADLEQRFTALVTSHCDRARRLAWRLIGGDEAAAEDVAQDAFVQAYRGLGRFREESSLETWFFRILVNRAHRYRRWRAVRDRWSAVWNEEQTPSGTPAGDPALRRQISRALDGLTRKQREAFVLVHLEGFTVREAADLLGSREGTVKSHLHRALQNLRRELAESAGALREDAP